MSSTMPRQAKRGPVTGTALKARKSSPWFVDLYRSSLGKKYVMAITGIMWMGYVAAHMWGNLKMYQGPEQLDSYAEWLKTIGYPLLPKSGFLWIARSGLIVGLLLHIHAAWSLTVMNRKARPVGYQAPRDYIAANWASRTMRWTGPIVLLFILWHLADITLGWVNPDFVKGNVYDNVVASFKVIPTSIFYIVANLALGFHLFHGAWSLFQSMGWNNPRFNKWRKYFAYAFAGIVTVGNVSFPIAVMTGIVG
jgi:succinate dehydrogenase / fumarate reductase cytochrome b subunit